jgi:hypothetical protein
MTDVAFSKDVTLLQFSQLTTFREENNLNFKTLKGRVSICYEGGLKGSGSQTWGGISDRPEEPKSVPKLFWGLFTGLFIYPDVERSPIPKVF